MHNAQSLFEISFAVPRRLSLLIALAISSLPLLLVCGSAMALDHVELDKKLGPYDMIDDFEDDVRSNLRLIKRDNSTCKDNIAKAAIEWLEWEKNYVGNLVAPAWGARILENLSEDLGSSLAKLKALPPCKLKPKRRWPGRNTTKHHSPKTSKDRVHHPAEESQERKEVGKRVRSPGGPRIELASYNGPFVGGQVGGSFSSVDTSEFVAGTDMRTHQFHDLGQGFSGGVNFGYNWQPWMNNFVVGVVFDVNGLNDRARHDFPGGNYIGATVNFTASAQARAGVLVAPSVLLYGQAGISIANQQLQIDFGGPETNESRIVSGATFGGGIEWKLPKPVIRLGNSTSLFLQYQHTWWDRAALRMPAASPLFDYTWRRDTHRFDMGVRFLF